MIGKTVSHFRILAKLGEGGMGVVYKAEDLDLGSEVALKFLPSRYFDDEELRRRFLDEARTARALEHPNICTIHEMGTTDEGEVFIAMPLYRGRDLGAIIAEGPLEIPWIEDVARQVCAGLARVHREGIIHRDLKPANLFVTDDGFVKILDFGLARAMDRTDFTQSGVSIGTPAYMAPEQIRGEDPDARWDVWSVGAVLYEMLTGRKPFPSDRPQALFYAILNLEPDPVATLRPDVPPHLEAVVQRALAKDPANRYGSAAALLADLEARTAVPVTPARKLPPWLRRGARTAAAGLVVALAVFGAWRMLDHPPLADAAPPLLAVMAFDALRDAPGAARTGDVVANLLSTNLASAEGIRVLSRQRLFGALERLGAADDGVLAPATVDALARRTGARWVLTGQVVAEDPQLVLTAELVDVETGALIASHRATGAEGEQVFTVVDRLAGEIREALGADSDAGDAAVAKATTSSIEAYREFVTGENHAMRVDAPAAKEAFARAVALDSTFAMANLRLAEFLQGPARAEALARAQRHAGRVTEQERRRIRYRIARDAGDRETAFRELEWFTAHHPDDPWAYHELAQMHNNRDMPRAIRLFHRALEADPDYKIAYNALAYAYNVVADRDSAIWAINKYIEIAPDEPNPYATRGDLYAETGQTEQAIASYRRALVKDPAFSGARQDLADILVLAGRDEEAVAQYDSLLRSDDLVTRAAARYYRALVPAHRGRLDEARSRLVAVLETNEREGYADHWQQFTRMAVVNIDREKEDFATALENSRRIVTWLVTQKNNYTDWSDVYVTTLIDAGDDAGARAWLDTMVAHVDTTSLHERSLLEIVRGYCAAGTGDHAAALAHFRRGAAGGPAFFLQLPLAYGYYHAGQYGEFVDALENLLEYRGMYTIDSPIQDAMNLYHLGVAYERASWATKAASRYEEFLRRWGSGDPWIEEIADARRRLAELRI